jgi:hypothetical protein
MTNISECCKITFGFHKSREFIDQTEMYKRFTHTPIELVIKWTYAILVLTCRDVNFGPAHGIGS